MYVFVALTTVLAYGLVACHPGEDHVAELLARGEFLQHHIANLDHCAADLQAAGVEKRSIQRRLHTTKLLREKRGLIGRQQEGDSNSWYAIEEDHDVVFRSTASCVLAPEEMVGPYCKSILPPNDNAILT